MILYCKAQGSKDIFLIEARKRFTNLMRGRKRISAMKIQFKTRGYCKLDMIWPLTFGGCGQKKSFWEQRFKVIANAVETLNEP